MSMHATGQEVPASKHPLAPLARLAAAIVGLLAAAGVPAGLLAAIASRDPHGLAAAAGAALAFLGAAAALRALDPLRAG